MRKTNLAACWSCLIGAMLASSASGATIGSPLISRQFTDIDLGQVYIYAGTSSPFPDSGNVSTWSFYDGRNSGKTVTPVLFQITGANSYTVTAIGTSRVSTGTGLQTYSFGLIAGDTSVTGGSYTFGFTNRAYSSTPGLIPGTSNTGAISFDRPSASIPNDPWMVTAGATSPGAVSLQIGSIIGTGGITIYNPQDPGGLDRVYSAQMTVPEPTTSGLFAAYGSALLLRRRSERGRA